MSKESSEKRTNPHQENGGKFDDKWSAQKIMMIMIKSKSGGKLLLRSIEGPMQYYFIPLHWGVFIYCLLTAYFFQILVTGHLFHQIAERLFVAKYFWNLNFIVDFAQFTVFIFPRGFRKEREIHFSWKGFHHISI